MQHHLLAYQLMSKQWTEDVEQFIDSVEWTWAKTYADTWPHHYIVKEKLDKVDEAMFLEMVQHIREYGEWQAFYNRKTKYFEQDGVVYWTMVPPDDDPKWYPIEEETIINKCPVESTYENRLKNNTLPE